MLFNKYKTISPEFYVHNNIMLNHESIDNSHNQ